MTIIQGRVFASSPDEAVIKIRDEHGNGELWLKQVFNGLTWFEYKIEVSEHK